MLVGAVLNGTANQFSEVTLQLFADDPKSLPLFLLNRRYRFEQGEKRVRVGDDWADVPQYFLEVDGAPVTLALYSRGDEHLAPRARPEAEGPAASPAGGGRGPAAALAGLAGARLRPGRSRSVSRPRRPA